ncbi:nucleotidyl transferase AbiEii/AbiGii toxin family protein [Singulisphaera acidiphila]|nr:nucleotidyl transferase AbiEii/AbiGii toxin family protein [Singulisphaera acidiphila]
MSSSAALVSRVAFKGGNALRFVHGNPRSTLDLDFSADDGFPDSPDDIKALMNTALRTGERQYQVKVRCQSIHRLPPGVDKTMPTYRIKACFQLPSDRYYQNIDERLASGKHLSDVIEVEISLNDALCETGDEQLSPDAKPLRVCTLNDIIAEKFRALLQQVPRKRSRPQDVFDIASMVRKHSALIDLEKVSSFLLRKSEVRGIVATKAAFNDDVKDRAAASYEAEVREFTTEFIPFQEAWAEVLTLVSHLTIPD